MSVAKRDVKVAAEFEEAVRAASSAMCGAPIRMGSDGQPIPEEFVNARTAIAAAGVSHPFDIRWDSANLAWLVLPIVFERVPPDGTQQRITVSNGAATSALDAALLAAEQDQRELEARAFHAVSLVQQRVAQDGGRKVIAAGNKLMMLVAHWAAENELTPGEAALVLSSGVTGTLATLPGMTAALARAITIEFARGPRSE